MKIADLKVNMRSVNIEGKVLEVSQPRQVMVKYNNRMSRVATAVLSDDSGKVNLTLWDDHIDQVHVNDHIKIENGYVSEFRGVKQLNVGRYGKLEVVTG